MIENSSSECDEDDDAKSTIFTATFYSASDSIFNDKSNISAAKKKITQPELKNNESFQSRVTSDMTSYHSLISNFSLFSSNDSTTVTVTDDFSTSNRNQNRRASCLIGQNYYFNRFLDSTVTPLRNSIGSSAEMFMRPGSVCGGTRNVKLMKVRNFENDVFSIRNMSRLKILNDEVNSQEVSMLKIREPSSSVETESLLKNTSIESQTNTENNPRLSLTNDPTNNSRPSTLSKSDIDEENPPKSLTSSCNDCILERYPHIFNEIPKNRSVENEENSKMSTKSSLRLSKRMAREKFKNVKKLLLANRQKNNSPVKDQEQNVSFSDNETLLSSFQKDDQFSSISEEEIQINNDDPVDQTHDSQPPISELEKFSQSFRQKYERNLSTAYTNKWRRRTLTKKTTTNNVTTKLDSSNEIGTKTGPKSDYFDKSMNSKNFGTKNKKSKMRHKMKTWKTEILPETLQEQRQEQFRKSIKEGGMESQVSRRFSIHGLLFSKVWSLEYEIKRAKCFFSYFLPANLNVKRP